MSKAAKKAVSPHDQSSALTKALAYAEEAISTHGLADLVVGVYGLISAAVWWHGAYKEFHNGHGPNGEDVWQRWPIAIARGFGCTINFNVQLIFLLACRKLLTSLRGTSLSILLPFDQAMPAAHMAVGSILAVSAVLHSVFHLIAGLTPGEQRMGWTPGFGGWTQAAVTGFVLAAVVILIIYSSLPMVRRKHFERFFLTHVVSAAIFLGVLIFHGSMSGPLHRCKWIAPLVGLYLLDRGLRALQTHCGSVSLVPGNSALRMVSPSVVRVVVPHVFDWSPGQYAELRIPALSRSQWHPFTIASAPHERHMVFFIKAAGNWTTALVDVVRSATGDGGSGSPGSVVPPTYLDIYVRGPFGAPAQHTGQYSRVLLIAGGVGVTPFLAVAKDADRVIKTVRAENAAAETDSEAAADLAKLPVDQHVSAAETNRQSQAAFVATDAADEPMQDRSIASLGRSFMVQGKALEPEELTDVAISEAPTEAAGRHDSKGPRVTLDVEALASTSDNGTVNDDTGVEGGADKQPDGAFDMDDASFSTFSTRYVLIARFIRGVIVSYVAMWLLLARIALLSMAATVQLVSMGASPGLTPFASKGLVIAELVLASLFAAPMLGSVALEAASAAAGLSFATASLTAVSIVGVILPVLALAGVAADTPTPIGYIYALVIFPATVAAFGWRHTVIFRQQLLVAPTPSGDIARLRAVDFLWTAPTRADDGWVMAEVASIGDTVRMHRFSTREVASEEADDDDIDKTDDAESMPDYEVRTPLLVNDNADIEAGGGDGGGSGRCAGDEDTTPRKPQTPPPLAAADGDGGGSSPGGNPTRRQSSDWSGSFGSVEWSTRDSLQLSLNYGRPSWSDVLSTLVSHSRSGSAVGVFVCGPLVMTNEVRKAAREVMRASCHRARRGWGRAYGENVRLTVRAENF